VATDAEMLSFSLDLADGFTADYPVTVEIATAPTLGQDGTLADENQVGTFDLVRGDAAPQHYGGAIPTFAEWAAKPGTYYWVAHTFGGDRRAHQLRAAPGGRRAALQGELAAARRAVPRAAGHRGEGRRQLRVPECEALATRDAPAFWSS
jgi:hypothetical protein